MFNLPEHFEESLKSERLMADYVTIYLVDFPRGMLVSQYLLGESAEVLLGQYCFIECVYVRLG